MSLDYGALRQPRIVSVFDIGYKFHEYIQGMRPQELLCLQTTQRHDLIQVGYASVQTLARQKYFAIDNLAFGARASQRKNAATVAEALCHYSAVRLCGIRDHVLIRPHPAFADEGYLVMTTQGASR